MEETSTPAGSLAREAVGPLLIALVCVVFFWEGAAGKGVFFHYDHAIQNYPYREFFARGLRRGELRLWTSDLFCGFPLFAESQGNAAYPLFLLLFGLLKPWVAYNWYTILHFALAGAFAYGLARVMRVSRAGSTLAGLVYMLAPPILFHAHHTNIVVGVAWLPALLLLLELTVRRRSLLPALGFAGATAMLVLGAQPQYTLYAALACGVFLAWRLRLLQLVGGSRAPAVLLVLLAAAGALGAALAAVQLLPLMELVRFTARAGPSTGLPAYSPGEPANLMTLLLPRYFGSPGLGTFWGNADSGLYSELTLFVGVAPLMLALVGGLSNRRRSTLFFAGFGLFAFLFSLGLSGGFYGIFGMLPVFNVARFPSRFAYVTVLCVGLLAGTGLDELLWGERRRRVRRAAMAAAGIVLLLAAVFLAVTAAFQGELRGLSRAQLAGSMPLRRFEIDVLWGHLHRTLPEDVWRLVAASVGGVALLLCSLWLGGGEGRARKAAALMVPLWLLLAGGELALVGREFNPVTDPAVYTRPPRLAKLLRELPPGRMFRYRYYDRWSPEGRYALYPFTRGWELDPPSYARSLDRLPHNANMLWGIGSVSGFSPLQGEALKAVLGKPGSTSTLIEYKLRPVLRLLGARYILTPRDSIPWNLPVVAEAAGTKVYEDRGALPRAFIVHHARRVPTDERAALTLGAEEGFPYRSVVLVHDTRDPLLQLEPGRQGPDESAEVVEDTGDELTVEAALSRPGYLVLADQYYPGWQALVDGQPAELLRVDRLLRGVRLEAGSHVVEFTFRPLSVRLGLAVSGAALVVLLGGLLYCAVRGRRVPLAGRQPPAAGLERPFEKRRARFVVLVWLLFLAVGTGVSWPHWRILRSQLDPRYYAVRSALAGAQYQALDDDWPGAYRQVRDVCVSWPENRLAWGYMLGTAEQAAASLVEEGRMAEAAELAAEALELAPPQAGDSPVLRTLARRHERPGKHGSRRIHTDDGGEGKREQQ